MGKIAVPQEDFPCSADVVVIGGGIVGAATAFFVSHAGLDTIVVERRDALGTLTTAASVECFRAQFSEPENVQMMLTSIEIFDHFAEVIGIPGYDINLHYQGYLFITDAEDGEKTLRARVAHQQSIGLRDVEFLEGDEVRARFPYTSPTVTAGTYRAKDGWLSAHEVTYGFAKGSKAQFCLRTEVSGIVVKGGRVHTVLTNRGPIDTPRVVIAAGPFSGVVARMAGVELPLCILRRQKTIIGEHPLIPRHAPMTIDDVRGAYWRPEGGGAALGWALPEEPSEPSENVPADWTFAAIVLEGVSHLSPFFEQVAAGLKREDVFTSAGQYTCTPDSKPIIGPSPDVEGLYFNLGYSGHGIMGSPAGGKLIAKLMVGEISAAENPFRFERFAEKRELAAAKEIVI